MLLDQTGDGRARETKQLFFRNGKIHERAEEEHHCSLAKWLKSLPSKHEALRSNPKAAKNKQTNKKHCNSIRSYLGKQAIQETQGAGPQEGDQGGSSLWAGSSLILPLKGSEKCHQLKTAVEGKWSRLGKSLT
jgi:hypothetical protein